MNLWTFILSHICCFKTNDGIAKTEVEGISFNSIVKKNNFYGVQFHPEKSAKVGKKNSFEFLGVDMLNLFPAIDVIDDNCVRLTKGDFNRVKSYGKAMQIAEKYKQAGFKWHIILEGSRDEVSKILPLALEIKKQTSLKVQLGGGFITIESIQNALKKGIDRILISGYLTNDLLR